MAINLQNAIIYARYSPRPNSSECESSIAQTERCAAYCRVRKYFVTNTFMDNDMSGKRADNRPSLQKAIEYSCQGKAVLVVTSLSRMARNTIDAIEIVNRLQGCGANLAMLDLDIDTMTPLGKCFFAISAAFWQMEREVISERTKVAMLRQQGNGKCMSHVLPFGWKKNPARPGHMVANDAEQEIITDINKRHAIGDSLRVIAKHLNMNRIWCRGRRWNQQTISNILRREREAQEAAV